MRSHTLLFLPAYVAAHGAMITPAPRSSHDQVLDDRNKCGSQDPYSKAGFSPGEYCGLGCIGESCLYYQIGCFQSCGTCSWPWPKKPMPLGANSRSMRPIMGRRL